MTQEFYRALVERDPKYEGTFFYAVESTGTFCRPTCPSRKPRIENCYFFKTKDEAFQSNFRPCLRCHPLLLPNRISSHLEDILNEIEDDPLKVWSEDELSKFGINSTTLRRQFLNRYGITFLNYLRMKRLDMACQLIQQGHSVIDVQQTLEYESSSGFRDVCYRYFGKAPSKLKDITILKFSLIDTLLGTMLAIADHQYLHFLNFVIAKDVQSKIEEIRIETKAFVFPGKPTPTCMIEEELKQYFDGNLRVFKTPLFMYRVNDQIQMLEEIKNIPFGQAKYISAAAKHNCNFEIVIPFHRVLDIHLKGKSIRDQWLLNHEQMMCL